MNCARTCLFILLFSVSASAQKIAGPLTINLGIQDGYILYNPTNYKEAYLIDGCGRLINKWTSQYAAAHTMYLRPNGTLLRTRQLTNPVLDAGGGAGGGIEIFDWDSNLLWEYTYNNNLVRQHHDIYPMPNGNVLILAWERKTLEETLAAGRNPALIADGEMWPEHIVEVHPIVPNGGEIVWEWHVWDHLIQDYDPTKANYGVVADHPELADFNFAVDGKKDWLHANALDYNPQLDQIMISVHGFNELWVIDHSTTTAEAAGHTGGRQGKGGDILYRWGNPMAYRKGTSADTKIFLQHHTHWIAQGLPQAGKIMIFNNGPARFYSSVEIIEPPVNSNGAYSLQANGRYAPENASRTYTANPPESFFSRNMSSAQMMPNGNLFIGSATQGLATEVTPADQIIWKYKSPVTTVGIVGRTDPTTNPSYTPRPVFRTIKYPSNYAAFQGRLLTPQEPVEGAPWADCGLITGLEDEPQNTLAYPNPADDRLTVTAPGTFHALLRDTQGKRVFEGKGRDQLVISTTALPPGLYLLTVGQKTEKVVVRH
ncbi:MAG: aryl-sulfate sulfotransferase [Cyclobacteriaceae bacterium]|nr:aryl-sulfate sulfotransferase [Cyclobacteriaceae bacterium]